MVLARVPVFALALLMATPGLAGVASAANWQPDEGDWTHYRRDAQHTGSSSAAGAFTAALSDVRIKWERKDDPGYWVVPAAADLDGDGVAEVVGTVGNATADPGNINNPIELESGVNVINGATGALKWRVGPTTGNLVFFSPTLGDIDADGKGDVVFLDGNPLTGTFATNKIFAYDHNGNKKWEFSDSNWGSKQPLPINGLAIGDVDGETAKQEVVALVMLAQVQTTISGGIVRVTANNPEYRLLALNGEGSGSVAWQRSFTNGTLSTPALADLDGDGTLDVVWGSGARPGTAILRPTAIVNLSNDWADDKFRLWAGGTSPSNLCNFQVLDHFPGEMGQAPTIVDLEGDGKLDIVQPLWKRSLPPSEGETAEVVAFNKDCTEKWRTGLNAAVLNPAAVGDLDGDGKPDVVVQTHNGSAGDRHRMVALRHDGALLWRSPDLERPLNSTPAIGDVTGDGKPDVLGVLRPLPGVSTELILFNGQTGAVLWRRAIDPVTSQGGPILADLDGDDDGRLEILVNIGDWRFPGRLVALEPELPDLRVTDLTFSAANHVHGVAETVSAKVANIGSRNASGALVQFFDDDVLLHEELVTLAPGASKTASFTWTPANVGSRTISAVADKGKAIPEWAENNNEQKSTVMVRAAELRFASGDPVFSDPQPGVGDTIQVSATVSNAGGKDASNVLVRFLDEGVAFAEETLASLPKGAAQVVTKDLLVQGEFDHTIAVLVDPDDAIVEEDETNNRVSKVLDVVFIAPDLTLGPISFSNPTPGAEEVIQVSVDVSNIGSKDASNVTVRFLDEGAAFGEETLASLAEGAAQTVTKDLLVLGEFVHTIEAVVDPANAINEEDETNNRVSASLNVLAADLAISPSDIAFSDPNPDELDTLTATVTVRNVGTGGKVPRDVLVQLLDGGAVVASDTVDSVPAGGSGTAELGYIITGLGPKELTAVVDPLNAVGELDEANNQASKGLVVGKVKVGVAMSQGVYSFREQASGVATLVFKNTGKPLAGKEFTIPIEYVVRTSTSEPAAAQAINLVAATIAQAMGKTEQKLTVCVAGRCVDASVGQAADIARMLGLGGGAAPDGQEVTFRLFTIEARTNALGQAGFTVPYSALTALDSLRGLGTAQACVRGLDDVFAALRQLGPAAPSSCVGQVVNYPALPGVANVPGRYRATGVVDWFGFGFQGSRDYNHV